VRHLSPLTTAADQTQVSRTIRRRTSGDDGEKMVATDLLRSWRDLGVDTGELRVPPPQDPDLHGDHLTQSVSQFGMLARSIAELKKKWRQRDGFARSPRPGRQHLVSLARARVASAVTYAAQRGAQAMPENSSKAERFYSRGIRRFQTFSAVTHRD
jgi:hypothetical protein